MLTNPKHCSNLHDSSFFHISLSLRENFSFKKAFLVISEILRPFVITFTPDDRYSVGNRETLPHTIQIQLSKKLKYFSRFFTAFLKSTLNFEDLEKKDKPLSLCVSQIMDCKRCAYVIV